METKDTTKADVIQKIDDKIMKFKYYRDIEIAAGVRIGLNSLYLQMRQEVHTLQSTLLKARRERMLELFKQDLARETQELEEVQFGYINTQP